MEKKLLIVVDYQVDFAAPDGKLSAGESALAIEDFIDARAERFLSGGQDVVFTKDAHDAESWANHPESAAFPPHCVKGTPGFEIYGKPARHLSHPNVSIVEKAAYCPAFACLEKWVAMYDEIEILGLVTDICVMHTAAGLYTAKVNSGSAVKLTVLGEGCASFNPAGHEFALSHMRGVLGMKE